MTDASDARPRTRLYVADTLAPGATVAAAGPQAHYLRRVLRLGDGDRVALFNGRDGEWLARLAPAGRHGCVLAVERRLLPQPPLSGLGLAFAPIKRARLELVIEKACELGVGRLIPVATARSLASAANRRRLHAHAVEAAEQCGRLSVPEIAEPRALPALLAEHPSAAPLFWADESGGGAPAAAAFAAADAPPVLLVGPEGGFTADEREALARAGARPVSLGPRILRAETAAIAMLAVWQAVAGDWRLPD